MAVVLAEGGWEDVKEIRGNVSLPSSKTDRAALLSQPLLSPLHEIVTNLTEK